MIRKVYIISLLFVIHCTLFGQTLTDTVLHLNEVVVRAYFSPQPLFHSPSSAVIIDNRLIRQQQAEKSLVPVMNTIPGVRMEQRSPGSYRLSIRGSLLRSPFGVRNVKVYMNEFPLTDASGNTYINFLDMNSITGIDVLKGPDGSLFGANSCGVVVIELFEETSDTITNSAEISAGSYGLFHENITLRRYGEKYKFKLSQGYQRSDGYRVNSSMERNFLQAEQVWNYSPKNEVRALLLYSDYGYQTPGGLTADQLEIDPRAARYPTAVLPGSVEQRTGVDNQIFSGGVLHEAVFSKQRRHVISLFGSHVNFGNRAVSSIEDKTENNLGVRTFFELSGKKDTPADWQWNTCLEYQQTKAKISNYGNINGLRDTLQTANRLNVHHFFFFTRFFTTLYDRLNIEAAISINDYRFKFGPRESTLALTTRKFNPQLMPKLALSYKISDNIVWRASLGCGFSPPTIDEIRSSDNVVNTELQPEKGWNYETGFRLRQKSNRFWIDGLIFNYQLQNAIVRRLNPDDTEYFVNVGGTRQIGIETILNAWIIEPRNTGFIHDFQFRNSYTLTRFSFVNYIQETDDYSGNRLTGVPEQVVVSSLSLSFPAGIYLFAQHNYTDRIPLNDANDVFSDDYHLVQIKTGCRIKTSVNYGVEIYGSVDNLLNVKYSLGNDLNAFGRRYFNPSPPRNYILGIKMTF